jgi:transcriptional regulator with XRE-family HTH domain
MIIQCKKRLKGGDVKGNATIETARSEERGDASKGAINADGQLGQRIRHLRKARALSLKDVAERTNFSISFLSQIERGTSSASIRVLVPIASALNVALSNLFEEFEGGGERIESIVQRREGRRKLAFRETSISKELVSPAVSPARLDVYLITIEPGGTTGSDPYSHVGEEAGIVLLGTLELVVDGITHLLREGDGFAFASRRLHQFRNPGKRLTQVIWVNARMPDV